MQKSKRLIRLMMLVNSKMQFTARELAEEIGVSVRTIQRDLRELEELGVPLYAEYGPQGGYRLLKEKLLPPLTFTEQEAVAMFFAYESLRDYASTPFHSESTAALSKFYAVLPQQTRRKIDEMKGRVMFLVPIRDQKAPHLKLLLDAAIRRDSLRIRYSSGKSESDRTILPIGLYAHNGYWYCPAYCFERKAHRLFRADLMLSVELVDLDDPSHSSEHLQGELTLDEWFLPPKVPEERLRFRVELTRTGVRKCQSDLWLDKKMTTEEDGTGVIDTWIEPHEIPYMTDTIFGLGTDAFVTDPPEMIERIANKIEQLRMRYAGLES